MAYAEAEPLAHDYELVRIAGRSPDPLLEQLAVVAASINDAPIDDLEVEDEVLVTVDVERPWLGTQEDTTVVGTPRGHRLGLLLKADLCRWLLDVEPQLQTLETWNAESNDHMIAVNEQLGYEVLGRTLEFQRRV